VIGTIDDASTRPPGADGLGRATTGGAELVRTYPVVECHRRDQQPRVASPEGGPGLTQVGPWSGQIVATLEVMTEERHTFVIDSKECQVGIRFDLHGRQELQRGTIL